LFGTGYYGSSYTAGLIPICGFNFVDAAAGWKEYPDTIDLRQRDQTHTALMALNDVWKLDDDQEMHLSGFFRTYNLARFSDFGLGLIRQSEFRTVAGGSVAYKKKRLSKHLTLLAGTDYHRLLGLTRRRDDIHVFERLFPGVRHVVARRGWDIRECRSFERLLRLAVNQCLALAVQDDQGFFVLAGGVPADRRAGFQAHKTAAHTRRLRNPLQQWTIARGAFQRPGQRPGPRHLR
jgi:hypothetical protein